MLEHCILDVIKIHHYKNSKDYHHITMQTVQSCQMFEGICTTALYREREMETSARSSNRSRSVQLSCKWLQIASQLCQIISQMLISDILHANRPVSWLQSYKYFKRVVLVQYNKDMSCPFRI